ncbi:Lpg1974 family pore-forming outer membrane protein [Candidatus Neptunichlamydia sp. REUL1]|uniref:Lpg1974 family pore-forming outer membrane protein n=1 Tax=Candidatus Neptunichlamydia sp. REUL1 TaxID=3064277 RepID=UPI002931E91B|nr:Lpg1974 family pore-forming outer membrane protein [Candidatus Neptunochlamydia sp. REUL1]
MDHTTSHIYLHYKMAELMAHRVFHPFGNPHLRMNLLGGLTGVWLHQGWKVRYFDAELNNTMINNRWKYWGFGLRGGLSFDWFWGRDFYATGKMTTALVVGHYQNHAKQETSVIPQPGDNPAVPIRDVRYDDYRVSYTLQFLLGPSYQKSFTSWRMEVFTGYKMSIWSNLQEVFRSTSAPADQAKQTWLDTGLVALHGLTTRATFNF